MAARGMAADDERPPELCEFPRCHLHLPNNGVDRNLGAKIVTGNRDVDAMGIQPAGQMTEKRTVERLPVTAVNENDDRTGAVAGKEINRVPRAGTVANHPQAA